MQPLPFGVRFFEAVFRLMPGMSIAKMSLAQIENSQAQVLPDNFMVKLFLGGTQKGVKVEDRAITGPGGSLALRIYTPGHAAPAPRPLVLHFHGGGWVLGNLRSGDWMCSTVARDADAVVISVDYRLAPAHKFPAGLEDCYAALTWARDNAASLDADSGRIGVMGDSAGGNLATVLCLLAKARRGPQICHQALLYPVTDGRMSTNSYQTCKDAVILSAADMQAFYRYYLEPGMDPLDWRISPLHAADHSGLPPALIVVAGRDPLHDEGVLYAEKLAKAGVPVILKDYPQMPHGFASAPSLSRDSKPAFAAITRAQRAVFYP